MNEKTSQIMYFSFKNKKNLAKQKKGILFLKTPTHISNARNTHNHQNTKITRIIFFPHLLAFQTFEMHA